MWSQEELTDSKSQNSSHNEIWPRIPVYGRDAVSLLCTICTFNTREVQDDRLTAHIWEVYWEPYVDMVVKSNNGKQVIQAQIRHFIS